MTTQPGPPIDSSPTRAPSSSRDSGHARLPGHPDSDSRIPGCRNTDVPEVPAPPNATTMTCSEFNDLDEATRSWR